MSGVGITYLTTHSTLRTSVASTSFLLVLGALPFVQWQYRKWSGTSTCCSCFTFVDNWAGSRICQQLSGGPWEREVQGLSLHHAKKSYDAWLEDRQYSHFFGRVPFTSLAFPPTCKANRALVSSHSLLVGFFMVIVFQKRSSCLLSFHHLRS